MPFKKGQSGNPKGRQAGTPNKVSGELKDMILTALTNKGGVTYLEKQADETPNAFLGLVGKILPLQVTGEDGKAVPVAVTFVIQKQPGSDNQT
jgi:hypothetical protein